MGCLVLRADIQVLIRLLKFANEIFETHIFLAFIFPCHCSNNTKLIKPPSILIWKIIQFYGSATTAQMITTGRRLLLVKCSSLEFEVITWALYQYWVGRFISLALEFTTCNIAEIRRVFRACDLVQSSQTCWWTRFW